jgi:sulfatase maturation enzyme AslB (radical SAM superfamily)
MYKKVNLITNGLFLDDEWADYLVGGSNRIVISVNAATAKTHECVNRGSDFTKVISNIRRLVDLKHKHASVASIVYKFTIVPQNVHEISGAIQLADALGCDKIQFGYDRTMPGFLEENKDKKRLIHDELNQLMSGDNLKIEIGRHRLIRLGFLDT